MVSELLLWTLGVGAAGVVAGWVGHAAVLDARRVRETKRAAVTRVDWRAVDYSHTCARKIGRDGYRPCGQKVEYLVANQRSNRYSGWHHVDPEVDDDHLPVPKAWVG